MIDFCRLGHICTLSQCYILTRKKVMIVIVIKISIVSVNFEVNFEKLKPAIF